MSIYSRMKQIKVSTLDTLRTFKNALRGTTRADQVIPKVKAVGDWFILRS